MTSLPRQMLMLLCFVIGLVPVAVNGQVPRQPFRLDNPEDFLERMFGKESDAERQAIEKVSISQREEYQAGRMAWEAFRTQLKARGVSLEKNGRDVEYIKQLVRRLRPLMKNSRRYRRIEVFVADTRDTDARSFPGGWIVVSRGLIDFCESEAAMVGVLGHEISHIDRGHQLYHLRRWKLANQTLSGPVDPNRMLTAGSLMTKMFMQPFRPEEETQADEDGARWAFELRYDPIELARVFSSLQERDRGRPEFMPSFLRSHPVHEDRFRAITMLSTTLKKQDSSIKLYIGRENLKRRIPRDKRAFDE